MRATLFSRPLGQAAGNGWVLAGLCVFFVLIGVQHGLKIANSERASSQTAYLRWTPLVRELNQNIDIWQKWNWPNPPMMAMILKPFMDIDPPIVGSQLWLAAKMLCTLLSVWMVIKMLDRPERPFPLWGKILAIVLAARPFEGDLVHGNVNLFILLTVALAAYAFTRGWDVAAGLSLSLGIACKVTPALFLPYLVWKRAWKTLAATLAGLVLWTLIVPGAYFGWQRNVEFFGSWAHGMVLPYVVHNEITSEHQNQSLPGVLERLLRARPSISQTNEEHNIYEPVEFHHFADISREAHGWIVKGFMAAFCVLAMFCFRAPRGDRTDVRWTAEFGAVVLGMLIFSERTWKHHAVTLLIPFALLAYQLSAMTLSRGMRIYLIGTLACVVLLMLTTVSGVVTLFGVPDRHDLFGKYAQVYGAYLWSFLLLLAAMFTLAARTPVAATATRPFQSAAERFSRRIGRGVPQPEAEAANKKE